MKDLKFAFRQLLKNPGFTAVAVITLALGIGANTAIFSVMDAVLYKAIPVKDPEQLVLFGKAEWAGSTGGFPTRSWQMFSYPFYRQLLETNQTLAGITASLSLSSRIHARVDGATESEPVHAQLVSGTFFSTLGVNAVLGRAITPADDETPGKNPVAVASHSWWKRRFGNDASIIGKTITFRSTTYTIVGVTPPEFFGASPGESPDVWIPLAMEREISPGWNGLDDKMFQSLYLLGRLKPGVGIKQANAEMDIRFQSFWKEYPGQKPNEQELRDLANAKIELTPALQGISRLRLHYSNSLHILMGVVALVLVIACANIGSLLLARAAGRSREIAVRMAMGAARPRLIRQLLTESAVLAGLGASMGILFSLWASNYLLKVASSGDSPLAIKTPLDTRVLLFTLLISAGATILFGITPALRATRVELTPTLKGGRGVVSAESRSPLARGLVISQVALCLVLLAGSGLFLRSLVKLSQVNTGFDPENVLLFGTDAGSADFAQDARLAELYRQIEQRVGELPDIKSASFSMFAFNQGTWSDGISTSSGNTSSQNQSEVHFNVVGNAFFSTMKLPILLGRPFDAHDTAQSPKVALINETMAKQFFANSPALGKRFGLGGPDHANDFEVVGIVKDAKYQSLQEDPKPVAYLPYVQRIGFLENFEVRFVGDMASAARGVRQAIKEINPRLPVTGGTPLTKQVNDSFRQLRMIAQLSTAFGLLAVFLACLGIYGLLSYAVSRRTNEIGIRMALGAQPGHVLRLILREAMLLAGIGLVIGIPAVLASTTLIRSQLFGLSPYDPISLALAPALLFAVAAIAGYLPARRAARVDPMVALRTE